MGAARAPVDAPATGAPAESVPAEELALTVDRRPATAADLFGLPFGALKIGDRFDTPRRTVQEADILQFADLTGDAHPQHVEPEWAAGSRFGEQIAHGLLVLSFAVGLLPLDPDRVVALRRVGDAVFKQPVKIGDALHVEGEITRTRELDSEQGLVEAQLRIVNQHGRLAVRVSVELVWRA
jgi:acyl dehydratase